MTLWGSNSAAAAQAPKWVTVMSSARADANGQVMFQNTTVNAFSAELTAGVWGTNASANIESTGQQHAGWELRRFGTGPVTGLAVSNGGSAYVNLAVVVVSGGEVNGYFVATTNSTGGIVSLATASVPFSLTDYQRYNGGEGFTNNAITTKSNPANGIASVVVAGGGTNFVVGDTVVFGNGVINAVANVLTVNSTGGILTVGLLSAGAGFSNTLNTNTSFKTANGSGATFTLTIGAGSGFVGGAATFGGRAGRIMHETLVAAGSLT